MMSKKTGRLITGTEFKALANDKLFLVLKRTTEEYEKELHADPDFRHPFDVYLLQLLKMALVVSRASKNLDEAVRNLVLLSNATRKFAAACVQAYKGKDEEKPKTEARR